ncbi:hypothetical protein AMTR_s00135p00051230 [Amborella trichopoda]|uniref:Uncharacterized protein n=1 Tax=Amborella trichopoda TaxID=13333 RepID=W1P4Q3_AMBTC|nr:hypothetical protein AMTR_s00135p00051230 [Amborella trichopoda]
MNRTRLAYNRYAQGNLCNIKGSVSVPLKGWPLIREPTSCHVSFPFGRFDGTPTCRALRYEFKYVQWFIFLSSYGVQGEVVMLLGKSEKQWGLKMYTEGRNGLKWASEGSVHDPILNMRNGVRNFGLPPSKLRSAYMSAPQVMPGDESGFGTESQYSTDSEEYIYGGRYSLDSSPQEEIRVFNRKPSNGSAQRYNTPVSMQQQYSSDRLYSDYSSSRETLMPNSSGTVQNGPVFVSEKPGLRGVRYPNGECADYVEDESSDSAGSSEVTQRESKHFPHGRRDEGFISEEFSVDSMVQNCKKLHSRRFIVIAKKL